jgi:hypothetical protein
MVKQYKYSPLQPREIRLLSLQSGQNLPDGVLRCQMIHASLDDRSRLEFAALSYTWGDPTRNIPILINNKSFQLHESAHQALCKALPGVHLWIDAVCINQNDNEEKAKQVPLMRDIYSLAGAVDVWLGPAADNSDFAIEFIGQLREILPTMSSENDFGYNVQAELERKTNSKINDWKWSAVNKLLERPWFTRVWVVQEVGLSTGNVQFICGDRAIDWGSLVDFLEKLIALQALSVITKAKPNGDPDYLGATRVPAAIIQMRLILGLYAKRESGSLRLQEAIQYGIVCKATNPRDKIYGLYGIAAVRDPKMAPDYNKSVQQVYIEVARHLMTTNRSLDLLSDAGITYEDRLSSLPSWVPNLNVDRNPRLGSPSEMAYHAGGNTSPVFHWKKGANDLIMRGYLLDTVTHQTSYFDYTPEGFRPARLLRDYFSQVAVLLIRQGFDLEDTAVQDSLMRTMVADRDLDDKPLHSDFPTLFASFVEYQRHPELYEEGFSYLGVKGADPAKDEKFGIAMCARQYTLPMESCLPRRRFCLTKGGRMGIVPTGTQVGDVIAIFHGTTVPFVLRKVSGSRSDVLSNDGMFVMVGESYIHGLMDGEGLRLAKACDITVQ